MRKLLKKYTGILSFLSFLLMLPIHYAYSEGIDNLFGIKLFDNATNYVSSEYIENNKNKNQESITGFWELNISNQLTNPYFDKFYLVIDDYNKIHSIQGDKNYPSEDRCFTFQGKLVKQVETKKQIKLILGEEDLGNFKTTYFGVWVNGISLSITCVHIFDPIDNRMVYFIETKTLSNAVDEFYNQY